MQDIAQAEAYEMIRKRLQGHGQDLLSQIQTLNEQRLQLFGNTVMEVVDRVRIRTENNCVPRDITNIGEQLLFAYNVYIGLKNETRVHDVFSLHDLSGGCLALPDFLQDPQFLDDFHELYTYYKHARLIHLIIKNEKLLASFQIGQKLTDLKVFRWSISAKQSITYLDMRGEQDILPPSSHDFEWQSTGREDHILGEHSHINILDEIFVETINHTLTIKIENNTKEGLGLYNEPVADQYQSLDDADIFYSQVGTLILLKIRPYRETDWRYFIVNRHYQQVVRMDSIGQACIQLPEDHGIIFPGGYYLQNGQMKTFTDNVQGLEFQRSLRAENGEDVLYIFYEPDEGRYALFAYNMIEKTLHNPLFCHGYSLFENGHMVIFKAENEAPMRNHPMQIWQTPFVSEHYASGQPEVEGLLGRIGNVELVRGISDLYSLQRLISNQQPSKAVYDDLIQQGKRLFDSYYWLSDQQIGDFKLIIDNINATSELVLDEFEKVSILQQKAKHALEAAQTQQTTLCANILPDEWSQVAEFIESLSAVDQHSGYLIGLHEVRYIDHQQLNDLQSSLEIKNSELVEALIDFLSAEDAFANYFQQLSNLQGQLEQTDNLNRLTPLLETLDEIAQGLSLLSETITGLPMGDSALRTQILQNISDIFGQLNQIKARAENNYKHMHSQAAVAEFAAQFQLLEQNVISALGLSDSIEKCDEQLAKLLMQAEALEAQFSDFDEFLKDLVTKRDDIYHAFSNRKQHLLDERGRRASHLHEAAERMLLSITRRMTQMQTRDQLNHYFASDAMVLKAHEMSKALRAVSDQVHADDIEARLNAIFDQALRNIRDKTDIYEAEGNVIRLGSHRFSVNKQTLDLSIVARNAGYYFHLTGTDFFMPVEDKLLSDNQQYWQQSLCSENALVYRAEYLAAKILAQLDASLDLSKQVSEYATSHYNEGYEHGIHDHDATLILQPLIALKQQAGLLQYPPMSRALASLFWCYYEEDSHKQQWQQQAQSLAQCQEHLEIKETAAHLKQDLLRAMNLFFNDNPLQHEQVINEFAADYLLAELAHEPVSFTTSSLALDWVSQLQDYLQSIDQAFLLEKTLTSLAGQLSKQWFLLEKWFIGYAKQQKLADQQLLAEAIAIRLTPKLSRRSQSIQTAIKIEGLLGQHPTIKQGCLTLVLDQFLLRLAHFIRIDVPGYQAFIKQRQDLLTTTKQQLRLAEYQAKPLTSFVRNRLINEVYLPIIGNNLAKQMGALGAEKRSDLMGLLLLVSPPGYGKTTLMEYIADRLGLIFMKINCPAIGHQVISLDPAQAPHATARQALEKLNLSFEMGNNVMLYLDDIQHTHPEFLQKFIALCDAQRRIEGVWKGQAKTYDLRSKKFCVIMAGNPYTESGDLFQIPDMLANRADIYNLGDILGGNEAAFSLSYIENSLTSNPVLAPLANRSLDDVYQLIKRAQGDSTATDLEYDYEQIEITEIVQVLAKLLVLQRLVLVVNQHYILSAAQQEAYRTEPPFRLQGSYRNMNKMVEKVVAVMNEEELQQLIDDHYIGEAQTLTTGAEENLLKLAELRHRLDDTKQQRWSQIKQDFQRLQRLGNTDDPVNQANQQLSLIVEQLQQLGEHVKETEIDVQVINQPVPGIDKLLANMANVIEYSLLPVVSAMEHKLKLDHDIWEKVKALSETLKKH